MSAERRDASGSATERADRTVPRAPTMTETSPRNRAAQARSLRARSAPSSAAMLMISTPSSGIPLASAQVGGQAEGHARPGGLLPRSVLEHAREHRSIDPLAQEVGQGGGREPPADGGDQHGRREARGGGEVEQGQEHRARSPADAGQEGGEGRLAEHERALLLTCMPLRAQPLEDRPGPPISDSREHHERNGQVEQDGDRVADRDREADAQGREEAHRQKGHEGAGCVRDHAGAGHALP